MRDNTPMTLLNPQLLCRAQAEARLHRHAYVRAEHLLLGLMADEDGVVNRFLTSYGVSADAVRAEINALARPVCAAEAHMTLAAVTERSILWAAGQEGNAPFDLRLLEGILRYSAVVRDLLERLGVDCQSLYQRIAKYDRDDSSGG